MKSTHLFKALVAIMLVAFAATGCLNEDNKIPENCYDGILNNGEMLIDCGGPNCPMCDPCENGIWEPELGEQWVDCGGECDPCDPSFNGQLDPGEEGIDCGGDTGIDCGELCGDGLLNGNEEEIDCGGDCDPCPSCTDETLNGDETGIDCGGEDCPECPDGVDCTNGIQDGDEIYIDCGGEFCPECPASMSWSQGFQGIVADQTAEAQDSGTLIITGVSGGGENMGITISTPGGGWTNGITIDMDASTAPDDAVAYTDGDGVLYSSTFGGANFTVNIEFIIPGGGGYVVGTFNGQLEDADGETVNINNGVFALPIN